ncbi:MAG: DUF4351 domain-containing protein [Planctomycetia bacterium]|nr:DUF4351 domain-containing protein [Planctomycetia bacterium]
MDDHDQRFKSLLREFLPEFFKLFFPDWAARFDFSGTEWLEQEAFLDPPGGEKRVLDVVAKVPTRVPVPDSAGRAADHSLVVVDVEIESPERATDIRPRMLWYYEFLRRRHALPVVPICLFLRVGLNGIGWDAYEERLWDHLLLRFEYAYIGLPALDGLPYYNGANLLGVALSALMKLPAADRARIKAEGLARIARAQENTARKGLLGECFNNYLELAPSQVSEFDRLWAQQAPEVKTMVNSFEVSGALRATRNLVRKLLEKKFGPLPEAVFDRLCMLPIERLEEIALSYTDVTSLKDLGLTDE